jgi:37-kD nucleoid-associated bacterial protein
MIKYHNIQLRKIAVHKVGNESLDEGVILTNSLIELKDEALSNLFLKYFLTSFSDTELFEFHNDIGVEQNEIFTVAKKIFENSNSLLSQSKSIAQHLYSCSTHPKIKSGEIYVAYFKDIMLDDEVMEAVGIFKSESKDSFLKVDFDGKTSLVDYDEGTNTNKLDKGCLIFNSSNQKYRVCIVDNANKSTEAQYWKDSFLQLKPIANEFHQTSQFLGIAKNFVTNQLDKEFELSKTDKIDYLNRSVEYFKTHENFDKVEFENEVFHHSEVIKSFQNFDDNYRQQNEIEITDNFYISPQAVKKQARVFKSVLKLDKNFHIYIHGNKEMIEQGVEKDGRKFYKIYYEQEH